MKQLFCILFFLICFVCIGQTKSESKSIAKIEKQILCKKVTKLELFKELGWAGGYEKTIVYIKNNVPILVEKEEKRVIHFYTDKGEFDKINLISAKFYILNWEKCKFTRIGQIVNVNENSKDLIHVMPNEYFFDFSKDEIEKLRNN